MEMSSRKQRKSNGSLSSNGYYGTGGSGGGTGGGTALEPEEPVADMDLEVVVVQEVVQEELVIH
jgi:hypothetical protein